MSGEQTPGSVRLLAIATRYEFLPPAMFNGAARDHAPATATVSVEWRGGATWAVCRGSYVWCETYGDWEWEPSPSGRTAAFLGRTRYSLDVALLLGEQRAQNDGSGGVS